MGHTLGNKIRLVSFRKALKNELVQLALLLIFFRILIFLFPPFIWSLLDNSNVTKLNLDSVWNRWDAPHFIYLAENWYTNVGDEANFIVFPPLYPLLTKIVSLLIPQTTWAAIVLSNLSFVTGSLLFYEIVKKTWGKEVAKKTIILLSVFPTSFFFGAPYTESLFLLLVMLSIWFLYKHSFFLAGLFAGLSFLTRHPGGFLIIFIFIYILISLKINPGKKVKLLLISLVPFAGCVLVYLFINWSVYQDLFAFRYILENHWQKHFTPPWISVRSSWNAALGGRDAYALQVGYWEAIPATLAILFIPLVFKALKKVEWGVWYTVTVLFITSTSFLLSTARYLVAIPPLFVLLGIVSRKYILVFYLLLLSFAGLLAYFSMRFTLGHWAF